MPLVACKFIIRGIKWRFQQLHTKKILEFTEHYVNRFDVRPQCGQLTASVLKPDEYFFHTQVREIELVLTNSGLEKIDQI